MSDNNNTLGKVKSNVHMITENNGISQKKERHRDETYKYGSVESSGSSTDVSNQIFIMRTKHVKGHEHWVIKIGS